MTMIAIIDFNFDNSRPQWCLLIGAANYLIRLL